MITSCCVLFSKNRCSLSTKYSATEESTISNSSQGRPVRKSLTAKNSSFLPRAMSSNATHRARSIRMISSGLSFPNDFDNCRILSLGVDKYVKSLQVAYWIGSRHCVLASDHKADKSVKITRPHTMDGGAWQPLLWIRTHSKNGPLPGLVLPCRMND